jgi:hypothetical protein
VLVAGYVVLFVVMVGKVNTGDGLAWTRLIYLFGSAEALAFAAVGWLFGSEVHRARAESAEKRADQESAAASEEREKAAYSEVRIAEITAKGEALATSVRAATSAERSDTGDLLAGESTSVWPTNAVQMRALADTLFPPRD